MATASEAPAGIAFGRFRVLPQRRELLADGRPVRLGGRAFDVLMALTEARGAIVSKDALMARVWPDRIVEENNLQWQISALRTAFGADRNLIRTVPGRGYQLAAEIEPAYDNLETDVGTVITAAPPNPRKAHPKPEIPEQSPPTNLPEAISELIGRDDVLGEILSLASSHRLVTLTGAGGIGKTRLAIAAARRLLPQFADGVWLAEFSPIVDPALVPVTVAVAIGLDLGGGDLSAQRVAQALAGRRLVLVLDTCEHVIGAAAALAEAVLQAGGTLHLLATSHEPLRAEGEWVYPVPPLAVPADDAEDADDLSRYGAVRLFVERLRAAEPHFAPDRRNAALIAVICRRLDGIPLAIELAAARAAALGVEEIVTHLNDRFRILTGGRRTALPRHQTLRATLDWSHALLSEPERVILRRLAVFAGVFSLEAASAVVASPEIAPAEVVDGIANLVAKSLVTVVGSTVTCCRLLDTTWAYGLEKLTAAGERGQLARRHAEYYRDLFERAEAEESRPTAECLAEYAPKTENLRAALDWAFSPGGDARTGIALTAAAVPLWMHLSLMEECRRRVEQAFAALATVAEPDARQGMKLLAALGASRLYTRGGVPEVAAAWTKALELAESLGDPEYQRHSLWGLWSFHVNGVDYRTALSLAHRFASLAAASLDPNDRFVGERMIGISHYNLGDQQSARHYLERALAESAAPGHQRQFIRLQLDPQVTARVHLARVLWLQGFPDRAMREAEHSVDDARATEHAISFSYALHRAACPVALWNGDLATAGHYADILLDHAKRHALVHWQLYGLGYQGAVAISRGDVATGLRRLRSCFEELGETGITAPRFMRFAAVYMAEGLGRAGEIADGLAAVDDAIARAERTNELWQSAELLRVKGELLLLPGAFRDAAAAKDYFRQALDLARRQDALAWELRAAASFVRLLREQDCSAEALTLLQPVYDRFTEGFETADLKAAKALLDALQDSAPVWREWRHAPTEPEKSEIPKQGRLESSGRRVARGHY
jgi:predicted ATPase/DNA-binding winged helix-turn-helix (wHTH) protein